MVILVLATVFIAGVAYKRFAKRRERKRIRKLAALNNVARSPVDATEDESLPDTVVATGESDPPPYRRSTSHPAEPPDGPDGPHPLDSTPPEFEHSEIYVRDKPPSYSTMVLQVQNA